MSKKNMDNFLEEIHRTVSVDMAHYLDAHIDRTTLQTMSRTHDYPDLEYAIRVSLETIVPPDELNTSEWNFIVDTFVHGFPIGLMYLAHEFNTLYEEDDPSAFIQCVVMDIVTKCLQRIRTRDFFQY